MIESTKRHLIFGAGLLSLVLGFIGIFLPVMPTAPFVILAAFCFSKSSQKWHHWIVSQPHIGPMIRSWETHGVIPLRAKILATTAITISWSISLAFTDLPRTLKIGVTIVILMVMSYIWTRPSRPEDPR